MEHLSPSRLRMKFAQYLCRTITRRMWQRALKYSLYRGYGYRSKSGFIKRTKPIIDQQILQQKYFIKNINQQQQNQNQNQNQNHTIQLDINNNKQTSKNTLNKKYKKQISESESESECHINQSNLSDSHSESETSETQTIQMHHDNLNINTNQNMDAQLDTEFLSMKQFSLPVKRTEMKKLANIIRHIQQKSMQQNDVNLQLFVLCM
jgi:hypothetical protein